MKKYISNNQNRSSTKNKLIYCEFLSGCFLVIKNKNFFEINGFDERYFLHFEDADITRTLSKKGLCIHYPFSTIYHRWNRGSHISLKQTFLLLNLWLSIFKNGGYQFFSIFGMYEFIILFERIEIAIDETIGADVSTWINEKLQIIVINKGR